MIQSSIEEMVEMNPKAFYNPSNLKFYADTNEISPDPKMFLKYLFK